MGRTIGICLLLTLWIGQGSLWAQDPQDILGQGNTRYEQGDFAGAVSLYDSVQNMGFESPELYYNLGNAHYKLNHIALSILNYERALMMAPAHEDAHFNLKLANLRVVDRVTPTPEFFVLRSWRNFRDGRSSGQWAWLAIAGFWLAALLGALFLLAGAPLWKRFAFFGGIFSLVLGLSLVTLAFYKHKLEKNSQYGIIMATNAYIKSAPDVGGTDLFILHEGSKVRISDEVDGWVEVRLEDGKKGWVNQEKLEGV